MLIHENNTIPGPISEGAIEVNFLNLNLKKEIVRAVETFKEKFLWPDDDTSKYLDEQWTRLFNKDVTRFLAVENRDLLKNLPQSERLRYLALAATHLDIPYQEFEKYFTDFPEDILAIAYLLEGDHYDHPNNALQLYLYSICANELIPYLPESVQHHSVIRQYVETAERRKVAHEFLLTGFRQDFTKFDKFGAAAVGIKKALDEASELNLRGYRRITTDKMFTQEFQTSQPAVRAEMLRLLIGELHYHLLFDEVFNSCFTRESVAKARQRYQRPETDISRLNKQYNVAHSIIFRTYQPLTVFSEPDSIFDLTMNNTAAHGGFIEEYAHHKLLRAAINELGNTQAETEQNVDLLVDFWDKNRNPIFGNAVAQALSQQNPTRAAQKLMERIRQDKSGDRRALAAILYRLEFGQIGISKEGVKYLERMYDLGLYNNPDYHVSRLTPTGEMGIFNEEKELIKYFALGDLTTEEKKLKPKCWTLLTIRCLWGGRMKLKKNAQNALVI